MKNETNNQERTMETNKNQYYSVVSPGANPFWWVARPDGIVVNHMGFKTEAEAKTLADQKNAERTVLETTLTGCVTLIQVEVERIGSDLQVEASNRTIRFAWQSEDCDVPWRTLGNLTAGEALLHALSAMDHTATDDDVVAAIEAIKH